MEHTGIYWQPIAKALHDAGLWVSVVNALLIHKYGNNSIRKGKTDKLDAVKSQTIVLTIGWILTVLL